MSESARYARCETSSFGEQTADVVLQLLKTTDPVLLSYSVATGLCFAGSSWEMELPPQQPRVDVQGSKKLIESARALENRLYGLICANGKISFTSLANLLPEHRWISLFKALHSLERQQVVILTPLPWDYEISARADTRLDRRS